MSDARLPISLLVLFGVGLISFGAGVEYGRKPGAAPGAIEIASPRVDECHRDLAELRQIQESGTLLCRADAEIAPIVAIAMIEDMISRSSSLRDSLERDLCMTF